ncbi:MAG: ORF6N domain-containing protein [Bacteroidales bacterium]|jgi:phage regulator Rha-like protein|nr:ORF6N domain-containing protein [Bacteroidales bacterium]
MGNVVLPESIENRNLSEWIVELRGRRVMLDYQLAVLYGVETKNLKRAVKANMNRFPSDFMFELTKDEFDFLRCRNFTSNGRGGTRYMPYAFTQEGIAMLSGLLRSEVAVQANIYIMRAFVHMRTSLVTIDRITADIEHLKSRISELNHYLEDVLRDQNDINEETMLQLQLINESLAEMHAGNHEHRPEPKKIGFK